MKSSNMVIKGLASHFGSVINALVPTIIQPGSFTETLRKHRNVFPLLWMHDELSPLGLAKAWESQRGLEFEARLSDTQLGREKYTQIGEGVVKGVSVGFNVESDFVAPHNGVKTRFISKISLIEISLTTTNFSADPKAQISHPVDEDSWIAAMVHKYETDVDIEIHRLVEGFKIDNEILRMSAKVRRYQC